MGCVHGYMRQGIKTYSFPKRFLNNLTRFYDKMKRYRGDDEDISQRKTAARSKRRNDYKMLETWPDVFAQSKAVLSVPERTNSQNITIRFFDDNFRTTFGLDEGQSYGFESLFGRATSKDTIALLNDAMRNGKTVCEYINLYRLNEAPLSCHVVLRSIGGSSYKRRMPRNGGGPARILSHNSASTRGVSSSSLSNGAPSSMPTPLSLRWAVLTVRSASVVGNARCFGIGFLGLERVPLSVKEGIADSLILDTKNRKLAAAAELPMQGAGGDCDKVAAGLKKLKQKRKKVPSATLRRREPEQCRPLRRIAVAPTHVAAPGRRHVTFFGEGEERREDDLFGYYEDDYKSFE